MNGLFGEGGLHKKILEKHNGNIIHHTCTCYFILNLDHVNVAYSAANIVAHATF